MIIIIKKSKYIKMIEAIKYAKEHLEYINGRIDYFDKSKISKSVTENCIKKLNDILK